MKRLLGKISVILGLVILLSLGIDWAYRHAYGLSFQIPHNLWILPEIENKYTLVKLGNSHATEGITLERYKLKSLSLTNAAQSFEYDLANLKMYSRQIKEGAIILINISPISFSQIKPGRENSLQTQYYDGRLSPFLIPHLKVEDYLQSQVFPFLRAGYLWRQHYDDPIREKVTALARAQWPTPTPTPPIVPVAPKLVTQSQTGEAKAVEEVGYFNVNVIESELASPSVSIANKLGDSMTFIYNKWYHTDGFGKEYFEANRMDLERLIAYTLKKKWRPVLVSIPISQVLEDGLLPDYMQTYVYDNISKTNLQGVDYFDFSKYDPIKRDSFLYRDSDHLNGNGAAVFSYLLLQRLIQKGYLSPSADGYDYRPIHN